MGREKEQGTLLRELAAILRDYLGRIDRIGPETFRLRGESFEAWDLKQRRVRVALHLLERAVEAFETQPDLSAEELAREVARTPEVPLPKGTLGRLVEEDIARLHARLVELHREHPEKCEGAGCPCRAPASPRCSRCLRLEARHGPGGRDPNCPEGFVPEERP